MTADLDTPQGAILSPDDGGPDGRGRYRYRLWRSVTDPNQQTFGTDDDRRTLAFVLLNPSTADATTDDPTLRRCLGYAERWGYNRVELGNLFAYRATDPADLRAHPKPVGPHNDDHLREIADAADRVVCAWGNDGNYLDRDREVAELLSAYDLFCIRMNDSGQPAHPVREAYTPEPVAFDPG